MPCYSLRDGGKHVAFICGDLGEHCRHPECGAVSEFLCDFPVGEGKTCDRGEHAHEVAPDVHYCAPHYQDWLRFREAGGVARELENVIPFKAV